MKAYNIDTNNGVSTISTEITDLSNLKLMPPFAIQNVLIQQLQAKSVKISSPITIGVLVVSYATVTNKVITTGNIVFKSDNPQSSFEIPLQNIKASDSLVITAIFPEVPSSGSSVGIEFAGMPNSSFSKTKLIIGLSVGIGGLVLFALAIYFYGRNKSKASLAFRRRRMRYY